jgi:hypothetical protein
LSATISWLFSSRNTSASNRHKCWLGQSHIIISYIINTTIIFAILSIKMFLIAFFLAIITCAIFNKLYFIITRLLSWVIAFRRTKVFGKLWLIIPRILLMERINIIFDLILSQIKLKVRTFILRAFIHIAKSFSIHMRIRMLTVMI